MSDNISVSIFMGSKSDLPVVQSASDTLNEFNVPHRMFILSAHRTPEEVVKRVKESEKNGAKVFIAAAGMAAHLAGAIAAQTTKPVLGIPLGGGDLMEWTHCLLLFKCQRAFLWQLLQLENLEQ